MRNLIKEGAQVELHIKLQENRNIIPYTSQKKLLGLDHIVRARGHHHGPNFGSLPVRFEAPSLQIITNKN